MARTPRTHRRTASVTCGVEGPTYDPIINACVVLAATQLPHHGCCCRRASPCLLAATISSHRTGVNNNAGPGQRYLLVQRDTGYRELQAFTSS